MSTPHASCLNPIKKALQQAALVFSTKTTVTKTLLFLIFAEQSDLGGITQSEVAAKTDISKVTVSKLISQMFLDDRLFDERHDPNDRRVRRYVLTEKGTAAYRSMLGGA